MLDGIQRFGSDDSLVIRRVLEFGVFQNPVRLSQPVRSRPQLIRLTHFIPRPAKQIEEPNEVR